MKAHPRAPHWYLLGAVVAAYGNAFRGVFQFDDYNVIVNNPLVHTWPAFYSSVAHGIRPFLKFTYTANWTSGLGLFGFHLLNVAIHAANTLLVYSLGRRFAQCREDSRASSLLTAPVLAALLFALHPIQTEAVTYISGRSMCLMAFFYFGSLWAYNRGAGTGERIWLHVVSPGLFLLAVLTRETAVTLPLAARVQSE